MYKKSFSLISFVLMLAMVSAGSAATYYVDFESGSDFNSGLSVFKHCPGDDNAIATAQATSLASGDTILFKAGVHYRGTVIIQLPTAHTAWVTQLSAAQSQSLAYREQFLTVADGLLRRGELR